MLTKYEQIKSIHDLAIKSHDANVLKEIQSLLHSWNYKCRKDDGELLWTNTSLPTQIGETIVIGLRYRKKDNSLTEDIFELNSKNPNEVTAYYKGKYQKHCPEYKNTHKERNVKPHSFISINSCSVYLNK